MLLHVSRHPGKEHDMIPQSVRMDDLNKALEPLMELLGTTAMHISSNPPLMIGGLGDKRGCLGHITFAHVPCEPVIGAEFPEGVPAPTHPQGIDYGELVTMVTIEVLS